MVTDHDYKARTARGHEEPRLVDGDFQGESSEAGADRRSGKDKEAAKSTFPRGKGLWIGPKLSFARSCPWSRIY